LSLLGIESLGAKLFRDLSSGQQQRVLLARALATSPDVLVLDEPTFGMDIASEAAVLDLLRDLNRHSRVTILIVTHMLPIVLNLATSIMLMSRTILHGAVDDVLQEDRLTELYGVPVRLGVVAGQRTLVVQNKADNV
jgi:ABC-type cobalamin/Fe3+-siderophores transport system ATPase subunit